MFQNFCDSRYTTVEWYLISKTAIAFKYLQLGVKGFIMVQEYSKPIVTSEEMLPKMLEMKNYPYQNPIGEIPFQPDNKKGQKVFMMRMNGSVATMYLNREISNDEIARILKDPRSLDFACLILERCNANTLKFIVLM